MMTFPAIDLINCLPSVLMPLGAALLAAISRRCGGERWLMEDDD